MRSGCDGATMTNRIVWVDEPFAVNNGRIRYIADPGWYHIDDYYIFDDEHPNAHVDLRADQYYQTRNGSTVHIEKLGYGDAPHRANFWVVKKPGSSRLFEEQVRYDRYLNAGGQDRGLDLVSVFKGTMPPQCPHCQNFLERDVPHLDINREELRRNANRDVIALLDYIEALEKSI